VTEARFGNAGFNTLVGPGIAQGTSACSGSSRSPTGPCGCAAKCST
jgi:hypothetical protein